MRTSLHVCGYLLAKQNFRKERALNPIGIITIMTIYVYVIQVASSSKSMV